MTTKKELGQFFTTNSDKILQGFQHLVVDKAVVDPFADGGDLLVWAKNNGALSIAGYDIDPKLLNSQITENNSLINIPASQFIITNPPYLATNKMTRSQKDSLEMEECEDLYLLAIKKIIASKPDEGIIIIPVNFFSAENSDQVRKQFMTRFNIKRVNYFKEQVFDDTTYNVVAFHFAKKTSQSTKQEVEFIFYPGEDRKTFELEEQFDYKIGGKDLAKILKTKQLKTIRLTEKHMQNRAGCEKIETLFNDKKTKRKYEITRSFKSKLQENILLLNCIDTSSSEEGWIKVEDIRSAKEICLVGKNTSRNIAYVLLPDVSLADQEKLIDLFNKQLNTLRKRYNSLFLTNFRDNDRKRISFDFCYKLIAYCYQQL